MVQDLNSAVGIFNEHHDLAGAITELQKNGFDLRKVSMVGGLLISWIVSSIVIDSPLASLGLPYASIRQYEKALRSNKFLLVVHGDLPEVKQAIDILRHNHADYANFHKANISILFDKI